MLLAIALLATGAKAQPGAEPLIDIDLMPGTQHSWIAREMTLNGVPSSIRQLQSERPLKEVVAHYEQSLAEENDVARHRQGESTVLATRLRGHFVSLQLTDSTFGTEGWLVISAEPAEHDAQVESRLPLPPAFTVVSHQRHLDQSPPAETLTLSSRQSVGVARAALVATMTGAGWELRQDLPSQRRRAARSLVFTKQGDTVSGFIAADESWAEETLILLTLKP